MKKIGVFSETLQKRGRLDDSNKIRKIGFLRLMNPEEDEMKLIKMLSHIIMTAILMTGVAPSLVADTMNPDLLDECGYFPGALSTRTACSGTGGGSITFSGSANVYDNPSTALTTCSISVPQWVLDGTETCESGDCQALPGNSKTQTVNYNNPPNAAGTVSLSATPSTSTVDILVNVATMSESTNNEPNQYDNIDYTWGSEVNTLTLGKKTNGLYVNSVNSMKQNDVLIINSERAVKFGTIQDANNPGNQFKTNATTTGIEIKSLTMGDSATVNLTSSGVIKAETFSMASNATVTLNAASINMNSFSVTGGSIVNLTASSLVEMKTLNIARGGSNLVIRTPTLRLDSLNVTDGYSGIANVTIYADTIDIGTLNMGQGATVTIYPYTTGGQVAYRGNAITASSTSTMKISSGDYYTGSLNLPGTSDSSSIIAMDASSLVNLYINGNFNPGNNPGINSAGNSGNFGSLSATTMRIFINGDFTTGGGGTTINAVVYVEGDVSLGSPTYVRGAISANNSITLDEGVQVYYDSDIEDELYKACPSGGVTPPIASAYANVDVVDGYSGSGAGYASWIKTKVSGQTGVQLSAVYLGNDPANPVPQAYDPAGNNQQAASITILFKLADMSGVATCQDASTIELNTVPGGNIPVVARIDPDDVNASSNAFIMGYVPSGTTLLAKKDVRIKYKAVDFNQLILDSGIQCAQRSSTGGVVEGIPSCLIAQPNDTSANQNKAIQNYTTIFGQTAYEQCYTQNGEPCAASNGGIGTAPYDHEYGCFECSIGAMPYTCSRDNFAIRPDKFAITSTHYDWANILRSGEDYNLSVYAYDYGISSGTDGSNDYNITGATSLFDLDTTKYFKNGVVADDTQMHGTAVWSAYDFNMSDGVSWSSALPGTSEVAGTQFDDVGKINLRVIDPEWSAVDINNPNDPTPHDCSALGAWICGDHNVTYIPHHFDFADLNITNNNGTPGTFTYIANEVAQMAGRIHTKMRALNKAEGVTQNFAEYPLWENSVTVIPVVQVPATKYRFPSTNNAAVVTDANETLIDNLVIGFGTDGDANGTKTVAWDETNTSQYLRFNFPREHNATILPLPFDVNGSELNITMQSTYLDSVTRPGEVHSATIYGDRNETADAKASFVYGRIIPRNVRVFGNVDFTANAWYEVYMKGQIGGTTLVPSRNGTGWFINGMHDDDATKDGNGDVTVVLPNTLGLPGNSNIPAPPNSGTETYSFGGIDPTYSGIGHIDTDPWLWYGPNALPYADPDAATNINCLTHPCFNINIVPAIQKAGSAREGLEGDKGNKATTPGGIQYDYSPSVR